MDCWCKIFSIINAEFWLETSNNISSFITYEVSFPLCFLYKLFFSLIEMVPRGVGTIVKVPKLFKL